MTSDIYQACTPRPDVLDGVLSDAVFAASLDDVVTGTSPAVYGDPELFFAATHPSEGLRDLLVTALGRLTGVRPLAPDRLADPDVIPLREARRLTRTAAADELLELMREYAKFQETLT